MSSFIPKIIYSFHLISKKFYLFGANAATPRGQTPGRLNMCPQESVCGSGEQRKESRKFTNSKFPGLLNF